MAWTTPKTDWTTGELVTAVPNIKTFLDFAIAVISTWQGNSWGIINSDPLEYGLFGFKGAGQQKVLDNYFSQTNKSAPQQSFSRSWYTDKAADPHMQAAQ